MEAAEMNRALYPDNWTEFVAERKKEANYTCEWCGTKAVKPVSLGVHHLDGNPQNNSKENTPVLCSRCHLSLEAIRPLTRAQFDGMVRTEKALRERQIKLIFGDWKERRQ